VANDDGRSRRCDRAADTDRLTGRDLATFSTSWTARFVVSAPAHRTGCGGPGGFPPGPPSRPLLGGGSVANMGRSSGNDTLSA